MKNTFECANKAQAYDLKAFLTSFGYTVDVEFSGIKWYIKTDGYEMVERMFKNYMN